MAGVELDEAGREQDVNEDVVKLQQEAHQRALLAGGRQAVGPVFCQAARGFGAVEARRHAPPEPLHDLFRGPGMPGRGFARSCCVNCCICANHCIYARGDGALKMRGGSPRVACKPIEKANRVDARDRDARGERSGL